MRSREQVLDMLREHLPELYTRFHVKEIALFGSYARAEQSETSDLDVVVRFDQPLGWEFVDLHEYLEQLVGVPVDVLTWEAISRKPLLRRYVEEDLIYV